MTPTGIVNVASVPQRSLFRYPGGKTWLVPRLRQWLHSLPDTPGVLVEPFAGGGIISLTATAEDLVARAVMVEMDADIAAVWRTVIEGPANKLAKRILAFDLSEENVRALLAKAPRSDLDLAFLTIVRNRVNRGGILAPGAGLIKSGENNKGLRSRWYPETLSRRIQDITVYRERLTPIEGDGIAVMTEYTDDPSAVFFIDPPYTAGKGKRAGSRLYLHSELDHDHLFAVTASVSGDFLMTYDNDPDVRALAVEHGFDTESIPMKNTHHAEMTELLIGRSLDWARQPLPQKPR
jgi:DNA adenine methylase